MKMTRRRSKEIRSILNFAHLAQALLHHHWVPLSTTKSHTLHLTKRQTTRDDGHRSAAACVPHLTAHTLLSSAALLLWRPSRCCPLFSPPPPPPPNSLSCRHTTTKAATGPSTRAPFKDISVQSSVQMIARLCGCPARVAGSLIEARSYTG